MALFLYEEARRPFDGGCSDVDDLWSKSIQLLAKPEIILGCDEDEKAEKGQADHDVCSSLGKGVRSREPLLPARAGVAKARRKSSDLVRPAAQRGHG